MTQARIAGFVLCVIGILVVIGSFSWWTTCPTTPCGGILMALSDYSGVDLGFGWISAIGGLALVAIGAAAVARPDRYDLARPAAISAVAIIVAVAASIGWMYVIPGDDKEYSWPPFTATLIALLGFVALGTSRFLRRVQLQVSGKSPT